MEIVCDTSFLMVLCYEPVKNLDALESRFGKLIWLIHPETVDELTQLENAAGIKRSKIANLSLRIIKNQIEKGDFRYLDRNELQQQQQLKAVIIVVNKIHRHRSKTIYHIIPFLFFF